MSELNHAKIDWSRCSRHFVHAKIYSLKVNFGQFLTLPLLSDIFMHFSLKFFCFALLTFLCIPFFRLVSTSETLLPPHVICKSSLKKIYMLSKLKTLKQFESKKACEQNSRKMVTKNWSPNNTNKNGQWQITRMLRKMFFFSKKLVKNQKPKSLAVTNIKNVL